MESCIPWSDFWDFEDLSEFETIYGRRRTLNSVQDKAKSELKWDRPFNDSSGKMDTVFL
jgi:hypothetical protein